MGSADSLPPVRVEVLGPLRLFVDGAEVDVRGPRRRAALALLALAEGRTVPVDTLVDALWPSEPPDSGRQALHTNLSRLRRHLGDAASVLRHQHDGYRLELATDGLDVARARRLLALARTESPSDPARAVALLRDAYGLWRGPILADLTEVARIATAVEACARLRREVTDALIGTAIAARQPESVLDLAAGAVATDPLRESAVLLLMRALAATGEAPEALRAGREYRERLAEDAGLDPSPALGDLEREIAGGAAGPPPSPSGPAGGSPVPARPTTRLIGREAEVAALHRLLAAQRLVTVVGPGGVGKTRVAFEIARPNTATTVLLLAPVTDPGALPYALAAALNLRVVQGDVLAACVAVLGDRPGLLLIDNCEHLLDAVRDAVEVLLSGCPRLTVLATSRARLGLAAEYTFRLAPLRLPGPDRIAPGQAATALEQVPSVAVFLDRAARVRPGAATPWDLLLVADIVRRLDGMPLAIELAAGRLSSFSLADLHQRLDRALDLLGGGRPTGDARHRTLRATVEWSYELLPEDERRLFRRMSVFVDGIDLDAAERLAAELDLDDDPGSVLAHLVDASMIDADLSGGSRYRMLETLRAFGIDRLSAAGEDDAAAAQLLRWAVGLTAWLGATLMTEQEPEADATLRRELPNLRAAWQLARRRGSLDDAVEIITALYDSVAYRDLLEIRGWAEELADDPALTGHPRAAEVLGTAAEAVYHRGDHLRAAQLAQAGLKLSAGGQGTWACLSALSAVELARGAHTQVVEHSLAAAALATGPRENLGIAALALAYTGDTDAAWTLNEQGRADAVSPSLVAWGAYVAGEIETAAGRSESSEVHYLLAIDLARTSGATFLVGVASVGLLAARARAGRLQDALLGFRDVIDYFARTGNWTHQWVALRNLADLLRKVGDPVPAAQLDAAADSAPDAPAVVRAGDAEPPPVPRSAVPPIHGRAAALEVARQAIERHLAPFQVAGPTRPAVAGPGR